jgi:hypothetical protein
MLSESSSIIFPKMNLDKLILEMMCFFCQDKTSTATSKHCFIIPPHPTNKVSSLFSSLKPYQNLTIY